MHYFRNSLGVMLAALACWLTARGTAAEKPDAPVPSCPMISTASPHGW